ncbi:MAG: hypothetical protein O7E52_04660 [Candidatus Poribacteria bacterium]|nr:hypothetical protein [Candidatus Poribacteria bacterium]
MQKRRALPWVWSKKALIIDTMDILRHVPALQLFESRDTGMAALGADTG